MNNIKKRQKIHKRRIRYGILGRNNNDWYWTLERVVSSSFIANIWRILYHFRYDETEVREQTW